MATFKADEIQTLADSGNPVRPALLLSLRQLLLQCCTQPAALLCTGRLRALLSGLKSAAEWTFGVLKRRQRKPGIWGGGLPGTFSALQTGAALAAAPPELRMCRVWGVRLTFCVQATCADQGVDRGRLCGEAVL